jgi:two-component system, OmpR family, response regulator MprA
MNADVSTWGKRILLVDDDPAARESIKLLLNIDRHTVTEAANAIEAMQLFTGSTYDLVITDYLMPNMLGDDLARNIKNIAPTQPVLLVTAYLEKLIASDNPADGVLGKPFSVDELRQWMPRLTERSASSAVSSKPTSPGFSKADLRNRASTTTEVLDEILHRKMSSRGADRWGINE